MTSASTPPRVWMVTGAARGIGLRIVEAALAAGDSVVATSRDAASLRERFAGNAAVLPLALDVTDERQAIDAVAAASARFGAVDVLVNNAGFGLLGAVEEASADEVRRVYETNVFGLLNVTRAVLPGMRQRRSGRVINISSVGGFRAGPGFGVYSSTKFAVEGLSEALHAELAPLGVHVTIVEPGYFRTEFLDNTSLTVARSPLADYAATAGKTRETAARVNLNQPGDPKRLAQALVTLAGSAAPPLRLPLGTDTLRVIGEKLAFVAAETAAWRGLSASTDFPAGE